MTSVSKRITQLIAAWLAVTVLILLTSCTKKDSGPAPLPPVAGPPTAPVPMGTPKPGTRPRVVRPGHPSPIDRDGDRPGRDEDEDRDNGDDRDDRDDRDNGRNTLPFDDDSDNVPDNGAEPDSSGAPDPMARASSDGLYSQLLHAIESQGKEVADRDIELASRIRYSHIQVDWRTNRARLSITILRAGHPESLEFDGVFDRGLRFRARTQSKPGYAAAIECVDARIQTGCQNFHIVLRQGKGDSQRTAHLLYRDTPASLYITGNPPGESQNFAYDRLMATMLNTAERPGSANSVQKLRIITTEVVGGHAHLTIAMTIGNPARGRVRKEQLLWSGPLLKHEGTDRVSYPLRSEGTFMRGSQPGFPSYEMFGNQLHQTRLIRNNGRGDIKIKIIVRRTTAESRQDAIRLTISRLAKPVRKATLF